MKQQSILIVDDHPIVLTGLVGLFKKLDPFSSIVTVDSLSKLKEILETQYFDLTVLDINFPETSVFNILRRELPISNLGKLIFFSAHFSKRDVQLAMSMQACGVLSKFESFDKIKDAMRLVLSGEIVVSDVIKNCLSLNFFDGPADETAVLTPREQEVLLLLAKGGSTKSVAKRLFISPKTVDRHRCNIMEKLNIHSQLELSHFAIREGIIHI